VVDTWLIIKVLQLVTLELKCDIVFAKDTVQEKVMILVELVSFTDERRRFQCYRIDGFNFNVWWIVNEQVLWFVCENRW